MADRGLVEALDRLPKGGHAGRSFRHVAFGYAALSGEGARVQGGRWNPPESFPVLYTALTVDAVTAELARTAKRANLSVDDLLPRRLITYSARLHRIVDLTQADNLAALALTTALIVGEDLNPTQAVGEAAHYVGYEGILAPSAALPGAVTLSIFVNRLRPTSTLEVLEDRSVRTVSEITRRGR